MAPKKAGVGWSEVSSSGGSTSVIVSLWVDGNYKAWKRRRLEERRAAEGRATQNQNRFVVPRAVIEGEFRQAGFEIIGHLDFLPGYAMWRTYVLRKEA